MTTAARPKRITRIIARLNIGGPAIQAISLTHELERYGYSTRLVRGVESAAEGNMDYLARDIGVRPTLVPALKRDPGPGDLAALGALTHLVRRDRPMIVHTHAAKGGTLGRLATLLAYPRRRTRPILVHTFHGHSLTGYFSGRTASFYRVVEAILARWTDALIAVSEEVKADLVELGVASAEKFRVVPLGFDLSPFADDHRRTERRDTLRAQWAVGPDEVVVTLIARLVPIKRVDRFLAMARLLVDRHGTNVRFVIVGDGELRERLERSADAQALGHRLTWAGFRRDIPDICFASDVIALTSDNEGTPVSLIEAQAAAVCVLATDVGGVRSAVRDGSTGLLAAPEDLDGLVEAAARLIADGELRARMADAGRAHALSSYTLSRLVADHLRLYGELEELRGR